MDGMRYPIFTATVYPRTFWQSIWMQIVNLAKRLCIHQEDDDSVGVVHLLAICQASHFEWRKREDQFSKRTVGSERFKPWWVVALWWSMHVPTKGKCPQGEGSGSCTISNTAEMHSMKYGYAKIPWWSGIFPCNRIICFFQTQLCNVSVCVSRWPNLLWRSVWASPGVIM